MAKKHYTALGRQIDMGMLAAQHATTAALGNAKMNARGDILGKGGVIIKTQEQVESEWNRIKQSQESSTVDIKSDLSKMIPQPKVVQGEPDFDPSAPIPSSTTIPAQAARRRKIVDSE